MLILLYAYTIMVVLQILGILIAFNGGDYVWELCALTGLLSEI